MIRIIFIKKTGILPVILTVIKTIGVKENIILMCVATKKSKNSNVMS